MTLGEVCEHGSLKRQCLPCELEALNAAHIVTEKAYQERWEKAEAALETEKIEHRRFEGEWQEAKTELEIEHAKVGQFMRDIEAMGEFEEKQKAEISRLRGELEEAEFIACKYSDLGAKDRADRDRWQALAMKAKEALEKIRTSAPCKADHESFNTPGQLCDQRIADECLAAYSENGDA